MIRHLLEEYLKVVDSLTINEEFRLRKKVEKLEIERNQFEVLAQEKIARNQAGDKITLVDIRLFFLYATSLLKEQGTQSPIEVVLEQRIDGESHFIVMPKYYLDCTMKREF